MVHRFLIKCFLFSRSIFRSYETSTVFQPRINLLLYELIPVCICLPLPWKPRAV